MSDVTAASGPAEDSVSAGPATARATYLATAPIHAMIYFTPHAFAAYEAVGLRGRPMGYFASRAAAMGPVPADVVIATFFNFNPELVRRAIPDAWDHATPADLIAARFNAVDAACRRILGNEVVESPDMLRAAAEGLCARGTAVAQLRRGWCEASPLSGPMFFARLTFASKLLLGALVVLPTAAVGQTARRFPPMSHGTHHRQAIRSAKACCAAVPRALSEQCPGLIGS